MSDKINRKELKRIEKYANKPLREFKASTAVKTMIFYPGTSFWSLHFTMTTVRKFFLLQWSKKLKITHYPVLSVDSPLDEKIPFTPSKIGIYMDFSAYFCRGIGMLYKRIGMVRSTKISNLFFKFLTHEYQEAYKIYTFSMTTTNRPAYEGMKQFKTIHKTDPHYLCVPSLHVTIAAGTWAFYRKHMKEVLPAEEAERRVKELREQAVAIIESVLFVKQHSVNCVPSALYMLSSTTEKGFFTSDDAIEMLNDVFKTAPELSEDAKKEINEYFNYIYGRNYIQNIYEDDWTQSIKDWMRQHAKETGQEALLEGRK